MANLVYSYFYRKTKMSLDNALKEAQPYKNHLKVGGCPSNFTLVAINPPAPKHSSETVL